MIVSLLGLIISLFAYLFAFPDPRNRRFDIYLALFAVHLASAVAFWLLSFEEAMDAFTYYRDPYNMIEEDPLESGTFFIVHIVQNIRLTLGGSFLDHFIFFQCFGMVGLALVMRAFNEVADSLGMQLPWQAYLLLFLPGLHFWSAGIGKDGPMIMAIALSLWASLRIQRRILWFALAVLIMVLIRPHIAAIAMLAAACGLFFSKQLSSRVRVVLAPVALIALAFVVVKVFNRFNLSLDTEAVSDFVETQQSHGETHGSGAALQELIFPLKVWSLLFRPFFNDALGMGLMGWAAAVENTVLLGIFGYVAYHVRLVVRLSFHVFFVAYASVFSVATVVALALVNYNLGLGQRQKMMAVIAVLLIFTTIFLYKRFQAAAAYMYGQMAEPDEQQYAPAGA
jgi:hypothetical protein